HTTAYNSIQQHTTAYNSIQQHTTAYNSIQQHTTAYNSIQQHRVYNSLQEQVHDWLQEHTYNERAQDNET
ncbi:MAG: hypothetical protein ACRC7H_06205, partial [Plesiomonas shigelloides]